MFTEQKFTKKNQIIKCATLELKPYGKTRDTIKERGLIENDIKNMEIVRSHFPIIDKYFIENVSNALCDFDFNFEELYNKLVAIKNSEGDLQKKLKDEYNTSIKECKKLIVEKFLAYTGLKKLENINSAAWLLKEGGESLISFLKKTGDLESVDKILSMKGSTTLYSDFLTTRVTAMNKWMPDRAIENMEIFFKNISILARCKAEENSFYKDNNELIDLFICPSYYNYLLTKEGIDAYNSLISGACDENGLINIGYNQWANEENTRIKNENIEKAYYKSMTSFNKAILLPATKMFTIEQITTNDELISIIAENIEKVEEIVNEASTVFNENIDEGSVVFKNALGKLSHIAYGKHDIISSALYENGIKKPEYTSLLNIDSYVSMYLDDKEVRDIKDIIIEEYGKLVNKVNTAIKDIDYLGVLSCNNIKQDTDKIHAVIRLFDSIKEYRDFISLFTIREEDGTFFNLKCNELSEKLKVNSKATNLSRNYVTKKLKSDAKKTRLSFGAATLLTASWYNANREAANGKLTKDTVTIISMDNKYYLTVPVKESGSVSFVAPKNEEDTVKVYSATKRLAAAQTLAKYVFKKEVKDFFENKENDRYSTYILKAGMNEPLTITRQAYEIYKSKGYIKEVIKTVGEDKFKNNIAKLISLYQRAVKSLKIYEKLSFNFAEPDSYTDISEFFGEIDSNSLFLEWLDVSRSHVEQMVSSGDILMFLITNKNMYEEDKLKTTYAQIFLALMSYDNFKNPTAVLNGSPSFYYRPTLIEPKVTHKKGSVSVNKKDSNGDFIDIGIYTQLVAFYNGSLNKVDLSDDALDKLNSGTVVTGIFKEDIIKDARYAREQFSITFSYTLNKDIKKNNYAGYEINNEVAAEVEFSEKNVLAITRGTENLINYCVIDKDGNVIENGNFNKVRGVDYKAKLAQIDRNMDKSKDWNYTSTVADIKDTYAKFVVTDVARLAIKYNAIIVVDNISDRMREKYAFLDDTLFGKFIDNLKNKLSCYSLGNVDYTAAGGMLNPLNLSFAGGGWQSGIVYTLPTSYTKNMDEESGFTDEFDYSNIKNKKQIVDFFNKFDKVEINGSKIIFAFNYGNFKLKDSSLKTIKKDWVLECFGPQVFYENTNGIPKNVCYDDIVGHLRKVIEKEGEKITDNDLKAQLLRFSKNVCELLLMIFKNQCRGIRKPYNIDDGRQPAVKFSQINSREIEDAETYSTRMLALKYQFVSKDDKEYKKANEEWLVSHY